MDANKGFILPILGLGVGIHEFDYGIDSAFFQEFEEPYVDKGDVKVHLHFDKRPEMLVLNFDIQGHVGAACDRCLRDFPLPIDGQYRLLVKYGTGGEETEEDIAYIPKGSPELDIRKFIYEFICLSVPMRKVPEESEAGCSVCGEEGFKYLDRLQPEEEAEEKTNPIWDELKKLNDN